nr:isoleucine--tRNA ligase, cytoplasmic-like [Tanacetum cinerariifolium]GEY37728.1 isoleucine--tRNA ligase, cytoplasmic-like [Tanacetum cinerariifolium]
MQLNIMSKQPQHENSSKDHIEDHDHAVPVSNEPLYEHDIPAPVPAESLYDHSSYRTMDSYQVVNNVQKLRSKSALAPTDSVEEAYIKEALGRALLNGSLIRSHSHVVIAEETYKNILNHDFKITLSR